jgi:hypothetical protein
LIHLSRRSRIVVAERDPVGDRLIRAAEPQHLDQLFEDDAVRDPRLVAAQRVSGIINRTVGQQRGELVPQRFQQP